MKASKLALVTVASDDFVPGALVMFDSFLAHHRWFNGDLVVIHDGLSKANIDLITRAFPQVVFEPLSVVLSARSQQISKEAGWKGKKHLQFALLQAFALEGYDRLVLGDSDLLFVNDILEMMSEGGPVIACGDGAHYRGAHRNMDDFSETLQPGDAQIIAQTFNSGLMIVEGKLTGQAIFEDLLGMMDRVDWSMDTTGHTDQMLLNQRFGDTVVLAPVENNYLLSHRELIKRSTGKSLELARVLHFTGPNKPWLDASELATGMDPDYFKAMRLWRTQLADLSQRVNLAGTEL